MRSCPRIAGPTLIVLLMLKTLLLLLASASAPVVQAVEPEWLPFHWGMGSVAGGPPERLGLLLPVTVNGVACTVQLDTGANGEWNWRRGGPAATDVRAEIAVAGRRRAIPASAANLVQLQQPDCGGAPIAIVGNALFDMGSLTLDLGKSRYAWTPAALLAGARNAEPLLYLSWAEGGGHVVVEVKRAGAAGLSYALLDTGAARFGVVATSAAEWRALTGSAALPVPDQTSMRFPGPNGEDVVCTEIALAGGLEVGGKRLAPRAAYCAGHSFKAPVQLAGTVGMAALGNRTVVLDYLSRRWMLSD